jgi:hypothetical protein
LKARACLGDDPKTLTAPLHRFIGTDGDNLDDLRTDLARFALLIGGHDGEEPFGLDIP